jgi:hypothetical protein
MLAILPTLEGVVKIANGATSFSLGVAKIAVKFWPRDACSQRMPSRLVLGNHKVLDDQGKDLRRFGFGK